jgi:hypothetical protein
MLSGMPAELVTLPSSVASIGPTATELIVAFRISERMSDVAVAVEESPDEVVVSVQALWDGLDDASGGLFPYLSYSSAAVSLQQALGERRVRAAQSPSFF